KLIKEGSEWRVVSVNAPQGQSGTNTTDFKDFKPPPPPTLAKRPPETKALPEQFAKDKVPSEALLRKLTTDTLLDMDQAIKSKDFKAFHGKVSKLWQAQDTPEAMKTKFGAFNADLAGVKDVMPTFGPAPIIDKDGQLVVQGVYAAKPN